MTSRFFNDTNNEIIAVLVCFSIEVYALIVMSFAVRGLLPPRSRSVHHPEHTRQPDTSSRGDRLHVAWGIWWVFAFRGYPYSHHLTKTWHLIMSSKIGLPPKGQGSSSHIFQEPNSFLVRVSCGPCTGICNLCQILGDPWRPLETHREIDATRICKIPHGRRAWLYGARMGPLRPPHGLF